MPAVVSGWCQVSGSPSSLNFDGCEHDGRLARVGIERITALVIDLRDSRATNDDDADCRKRSMKSKSAIRASACVLNRHRSRSSHSSVAKKLSHMALS